MPDLFASLIQRVQGKSELVPRQPTLFAPSPYRDGILGAPTELAPETSAEVESQPRTSSASEPPAPSPRITRPEPTRAADEPTRSQPLQPTRPAPEVSTIRPALPVAEPPGAVTPRSETGPPGPDRLPVIRETREARAPQPPPPRAEVRERIESRIETVRVVEHGGPDMDALLARLRGSLPSSVPGRELTPVRRDAPVRAPAPALISTREDSPRAAIQPLAVRVVEKRTAVEQAVPAPSKPVLPQPPVVQMRAPERAPAVPTLPPAAIPPPTIQVTIGRIEVRALPASMPPRSQSPARPRLSLEEYLRQRDGGTR